MTSSPPDLAGLLDYARATGKSPEETAIAIRNWHEDGIAYGENQLRESDPVSLFHGLSRLDADVSAALVQTATLAASERISRDLPDETSRIEFSHAFDEAGGDPSKIGEERFRRLAESLETEVFRSEKFTLPRASKIRPLPLATDSGVILGDFETRARRDDGGLDISIRLDDEDSKSGSLRKILTVPKVTDEEVEAERKKAEEEASKQRDSESRSKASQDQALLYPHQGSLYVIGSHQRDAETARLKAEEAEARAAALSDPAQGPVLLLRERVEEAVREDDQLSKAIGDYGWKAFGEDFWRGVEQTYHGAGMTILDAAGAVGMDVEDEKAVMREAISMLGQSHPGSTNWQFRGGAGSFASETAAVLGGMAPTMAVSGAAGIKALSQGGLSLRASAAARAGALAPISLSAYGNAYATMLNEADGLAAQGKTEEAEQRRRDARKYAFAQAAVETASEFIFKEEMLPLQGGGFLRRVGRGAVQNTAEEFIAAVGNAETNRAYRDELTSAGQIAKETAMGTVVGGLMQVPGGIVEVFLPKGKTKAGDAPAPEGDPSQASGPSSPPPESGSGQQSAPPPSEPPPPGRETATPPGDGAVYRVGDRAFTLQGVGENAGQWMELRTDENGDPDNRPLDTEAEAGLAVQLGEARRRLNAGETPVAQGFVLDPEETPTVLTIDGGRAFMPSPDGRGWLEVFPQTGEAKRMANFAAEGAEGITILQRLQAKMETLGNVKRGDEATVAETETVEPTAGSVDRTVGDEEVNTPDAPQVAPPDGVVSSGKPNGAKARFQWRIVSRQDLDSMVVREIEEAQTRQRSGNVASDEQRERIATGLDPDLVFESPVSSLGAPAIFEGKILAGNGRADGIAEAYRRGLAGDYEARVREFAAEKGLDVPAEPILVREIVGFQQGDARSFVVESNPKRGGMLAESVSEQALLDSETIGDETLANLTFTADGNLSAGSLSAVASRLEEANRGITRTLSGQFDLAEATRRVMAAFLSRLVSQAGKDASDVAAILETDGGKRAVSAIAKAAPRLSRLDDDLSLAVPIVEAIMELKSGLAAVSKGDFSSIADWMENRSGELLATSMDPVASEMLSVMAESTRSAAALRDFLDDYLAETEAEQKERDNARAMGDIFGDERPDRSAEDIFRALGRIAAPSAKDSSRTDSEGQGEDGGGTGGTGRAGAEDRSRGVDSEARHVAPATGGARPGVGPEAEGQLIPEGDMPFNLAGETIVEPEPVEPPDNRTDEERDADSGQGRLFEDRTTPQRSPRETSSQVADHLVEGFLARHPAKRPDKSTDPGEAAEERMHEVRDAVASQVFGGDMPQGVRVVWQPEAAWDASYNRDSGTIELNAAVLRPGDERIKTIHEIGHHLFRDPEFVAAFEDLWSALPEKQRERISKRVERHVQQGHYRPEDAVEESRVRAWEAIHLMAAGDHADASVKSAWRKFVEAVAKAWRRITGRDPVDPTQLAAAMLEVGVMRMREERTGDGGSIASIAEEDDAFQESLVRFQFGQHDTRQSPSFPVASPALRAAGIAAERITLPWSVIRAKQEKHGISVAKMIQLPRFVRDPIIVFDSETWAGGKLILTELRQAGESLAVAIHMEGDGTVAEIRSVHGRPASQYVRFIQSGDAVYYHQEKSRKWLSQVLSGVQFPPSWVQLRQTKGIVSDTDVQGEILSLNDAVSREQARDAQNLANLESVFRAAFHAGDFDGASRAIDSADLPAFEAFVRKLVRNASAGDIDAEGMVGWIEAANAGERPATGIDAEAESIMRAKRARFPGGASRPGRRARPLSDMADRHATPQEFERAFAGHVAAGDFQSAYEAVRDSDDPAFIPVLKKWMKASRAGDATAKKNLEWIKAILNGTVPEGVSAPAPQPSSGPTQPPPPPSAPAPKNPPPRPNGVEKLSIPALVFLARQMGTVPVVRRMKARGSYRPSDKRGEEQRSPEIRLNEFLGKQDWQGAARTLAHEIGHMIDYIVSAVPNADIVKRLVPLEQARDQFIEDIFGAGVRYVEAKKFLMAEAVALSKLMRGDFSPDDPYRNASVELYADFLSAVMIDPDLAFDTAPLMSHAWFAHLEQKPAADDAWNLIQDILKGDGLHVALREDRNADSASAMKEVADRADRRAERERPLRRFQSNLVGSFWSRFTPAGAKGVTTPGWRDHFRFVGRWWDSSTKPKEGDFVAKMEGAEIEASQRGSALRLRIQRDVYDALRRHGIGGTHLDEYLTFHQIIEEDSGTLQYLRDNAGEFREFLLWLDDAAGLGKADEIRSADDSKLDQIGAEMVGAIQLGEKFESVYGMAQSPDAPEIAERGLFAFDIARYQWNQQGHTPETARKGMDFLRRELGAERFAALEQAARAFHGHLEPIVREAREVGLFGDRVWSEKIEPNLGNYVPRMVLDYYTGEMSASIRSRRGSVKNTLPKQLAAEGQAMTMLHKIAKQKQVLFILDQAKAFGWEAEIRPLDIPRGERIDDFARKLRREEGRAMRGYYVDGKWQWLAFDDPDVVQWLDSADAGALKFALDLGKANENVWRVWTTVLKASFALWNNPVRTIKTGLSDFGYRAPQWAYHAVRQFPEALDWAKASLGIAPPSERVLDLVERGVLPAFGQYVAADLRISNADLVAQVAEGLTGIEALRRGHVAKGAVSKATKAVLDAPGIRQIVQAMSLFSGTFEALPKLATESFWNARGLPQWERDRLARMEGIPNTGTSAGKFGTWMGTVSLFYRVWAQGTRRMATMPVNPRTRGMWWTGRFVDLGIKGFYAAAAAGILDALLGGDDEDRQVDWQEAYTRISNFKIANGDAIFCGWALPDGGYEVPWGHSAIPSNWTPIFLRLPVSESGRASEPLSMLLLGMALPDNPLAPATSGDRSRRVRDMMASLAPSLNPIFENAGYALSINDPAPPRDPYSGRDVVSRDEWNAGTASRIWGIGKHLLEQTPWSNFAPALQSGINNERNLPPWLRIVTSIPGASAAIATDNAPLAADYMRRIEDRDRILRKAKAMQGPKTRQASALQYRLSRIPPETRTPQEQAKLDELNAWRRLVYSPLNKSLQMAASEGKEDAWSVETLETESETVLRSVGRIGR